MKLLLISGHGAGDPGASGNGYNEVDLTREMTKNIGAILSQYCEITIYPTDRNCYKDIVNGQLKVDFKQFDYIFEIHFNAGGGIGTEIYVTSKEKVTKVEQLVMNALSPMFKVRGVKVKDFLVIKTAKNKGVSSALLETCFIDNANDVATYQTRKNEVFNNIASAIVTGFKLNTSKSTETETSQSPQSQSQYLNLHPSVSPRTVYDMNKNKVGLIKPANFGGLSYEVKGHLDNRYAIIITQKYGQVSICIDSTVADGFSIDSNPKFGVAG